MTVKQISDHIQISIHAPREGCDRAIIRRARNLLYFNPRTPRGVRLGGRIEWENRSPKFQSTHPARGATTTKNQRVSGISFQSTHPARGATPRWYNPPHRPVISIHAPREGCDLKALRPVSREQVFQSTHPARGATGAINAMSRAPEFQSTHPARGATPGCCDKTPCSLFQSTHPARGATEPQEDDYCSHGISIHAPREGCDCRDCAKV